ncbi:hypothetical protein Tco_1007402 [Tanacetum coccineum]
MVNGVMGQASLYTNGTTRLIDQILGGPTGKTDGAVVLSMVKMNHLVAKLEECFAIHIARDALRAFGVLVPYVVACFLSARDSGGVSGVVKVDGWLGVGRGGVFWMVGEERVVRHCVFVGVVEAVETG